MQPKSILVVDDDAQVLRAAGPMLSSEGWKIVTAKSATEALGLLEEYSADVVICDIGIKDMDSVAFLKEVRAIDGNIIRMISTVDTEREALTKAFAEGDVQQVLSKPWVDRQVVELVHSALRQATSQDAEMQGLHRIISEIGSLPPVPRVYAEVCQVTEDPATTDTDEVARVIGQDPAIAAKILQIANSAFFGQTRQVETMARAVIVLGLEMVKNLVLAANVFETFDTGAVKGLKQEEFWRHCLACSMAASLIERRISKKRQRAETAMLAGTLHDLGKLVLAQYMPERYAEVVDMSRVRQDLLADVEDEMLGSNHAAVGGYLAEWWNLPRQISEALHCHHYPAESEDPLASVVHLADVVVHRAGVGHSGCGRIPQVDESATEALNIDAKTLRAVEKQLVKAVA